MEIGLAAMGVNAPSRQLVNKEYSDGFLKGVVDAENDKVDYTLVFNYGVQQSEDAIYMDFGITPELNFVDGYYEAVEANMSNRKNAIGLALIRMRKDEGYSSVYKQDFTI